MVALNYQSNDLSMCLQNGLFNDNGRCGYVLKAAVLRKTTEKFIQQSKELCLRIISAQTLPKEVDGTVDSNIVDPFVKVTVHGLAADCVEHRTPSVHSNGLNPIWNHQISLNITCPDLCLIVFKVRDETRLGTSTFLGQACVPVTVLQDGYRHIKLQNRNGQYLHSTLFVHVIHK
jgi:Ca2+-dependent lipid-binding protein